MCAANTVRFVQLSQLCIESIMRDRCALEVVAASQARELVEARQRVQAAGMLHLTWAAALIAFIPRSCSVCVELESYRRVRMCPGGLSSEVGWGWWFRMGLSGRP